MASKQSNKDSFFKKLLKGIFVSDAYSDRTWDGCVCHNENSSLRVNVTALIVGTIFLMGALVSYGYYALFTWRPTFEVIDILLLGFLAVMLLFVVVKAFRYYKRGHSLFCSFRYGFLVVMASANFDR